MRATSEETIFVFTFELPSISQVWGGRLAGRVLEKDEENGHTAFQVPYHLHVKPNNQGFEKNIYIFTSNISTSSLSVPRLKKTLPAMNTCGHRLAGYLQSNQDKDQVDAVLFSKKFFMNCIASIGFGIDIDTYGDAESEFEKQGRVQISLNIDSNSPFGIQ